MDHKIIEKIRKLLSLADSDNEHEANLAMERANDLLLRHNLSTADVGGDDKTIKTEAFGEESRRVCVEESFIIDILKEHFFIDAYYKQAYKGRSERTARRVFTTRLHLVGEPLNLQVAFYTYGFLLINFQRLWHKYRIKNNASVRDKRTYYAGLRDGICSKLQTQKAKVQTETGLVWVGNAAIKKHMADLELRSQKGSPIRGNESALNSGIQDGRDLELTKALKKNESAEQSGKYLK